ncbi:unnamed protein product [Aphanomyces euteiches]
MEEREPVTSGHLTETGFFVEDADFEWDASFDKETDTSKDSMLHEINMNCSDKTLHAVVGAVGSGKSTLISAILGDARCTKGKLHRFGSIAYVGQQPFIRNATLRDNITFGRIFDHRRYQNAIRVSCLTDDLKILLGGDMTEIGEKGINLSGGQRTRVAIARVVYQGKSLHEYLAPNDE